MSIIRIGLIGGSKPLGPFGRIVSIAKKFRLGVIPAPDNPSFTFVSYGDLVWVFEGLVESAPIGGSFSASRENFLINMSSALDREMSTKIVLLKFPGKLLYLLLRIKESIFGIHGLRSDSIGSLNPSGPVRLSPSIWGALDLGD